MEKPVSSHSHPDAALAENRARRNTFIHDIIDEDLRAGRHQRIVTRFPPEPNGYLHIGHAKSIVLNSGLASEYQGRFHLRFDDTNPLTEDTEYVESIKADVAWLGAKWGEQGEYLYFASDYFEQMYACAVTLIKKGLAYVDSLDVETIRQYRGTLSEPGRPSPFRDRSVEENLDLFARMRKGEFPDGAHVLRARIDMAAANMLMRDPLLYRIRHAHHHRTGDAWCIYPMYDFAHCLEDAFEGITHSICTLEFENNRELYDWVIREAEVPCTPKQIEFARLSLGFTVMSKRKLLQLVRDHDVQGWDDPRMPTIAGLRRRGVTPEAIRQFCHLIGVAKANSSVDIELLEFAIRDDLNTRAPRVMCVLNPLKVVLTNFPEGRVEELDADYWPHDVPREGSRPVPFTREIYIERDDFLENPPKGFYRLAPGREVRLRYGYFIKCEEVVKDEAGQIVELRCTYDPETRGGCAPDGRKVKGTIHWVSASHSLEAEVRLYDRLFAVEKPDADAGADFRTFLNPESLVRVQGARVEPSVQNHDIQTRYQFERQGYFWQDPVDSRPGQLVFNRIVALRDSWSKEQARQGDVSPEPAEPLAPAPKAAAAGPKAQERPNKRPASYERDKARAENPALAGKLEHFAANLGLGAEAADLLSGELALASFFEEALETGGEPRGVAAWIINELLPTLGEGEGVQSLGFKGQTVGQIVALVTKGRITNQASREVLAVVRSQGGDPEGIVVERGLGKIEDSAALGAMVDGVLAAHPDNVEKYRQGKTALLGFFVGQVLKASAGAADAVRVRELVLEKLG